MFSKILGHTRSIQISHSHPAPLAPEEPTQKLHQLSQSTGNQEDSPFSIGELKNTQDVQHPILNAKQETGQTPVDIVLSQSQGQNMDALNYFARQNDVDFTNIVVHTRDLEATDSLGYTLMHTVAELGSVKKMAQVVCFGGSLSTKTPSGLDALDLLTTPLNLTPENNSRFKQYLEKEFKNNKSMLTVAHDPSPQEMFQRFLASKA
jgi:hypothetical protein